MKLTIAFAMVLAVASAQFSSFSSTPAPYRPNTYRPYQPQYTAAPSPSPIPLPAVPIVNRVTNNERDAQTIVYENDIGPDGSFRYTYQTDNGIAANAQGTPRDFGGNPPLVPVVIQGGFGWTSPEGIPIEISYTADENGYQPQGAAIPTPPPIPRDILKALEFIARNPPAPQKK